MPGPYENYENKRETVNHAAPIAALAGIVRIQAHTI